MKTAAKIAIIAALALAVAATVAIRGGRRAAYVPVPERPAPAATGAPAAAAEAAPAALPVAVPTAATADADTASPAAPPAAVAAASLKRPRLLELGSMRCQACLEMAKVLDALRASQGRKLQVDFIDVFEQAEAMERYRISLIPTQILYDASGKEIFRHQGYFSHDAILAKFRELGVDL